MNKNNMIKLDVYNSQNRKYKMKTIQNSLIYKKKLKNYLSKLFYLI